MQIKRPTPYYVEALRPPVEAIWGKHPAYGSDSQIAEMCAYQMLTSFYERAKDDIETRRDLLYCYLRGPFSTGDPDSILDKTYQWLPIETFLPKVTDALAIAYNEAPTRTWKQTGTSKEHESNATLQAIYKAANTNGRLQIAHRYARLTGCVVRPYIGARGRLQYEILTPDLFRFQTHPQFPDRLTELTKPLLRYNGDKPETVFEVWKDNVYYYLGYDGKPTWYEDDAGNRIEGEQENRYGRIPYAIMRLVEPNDNCTFDSGLLDIAEANLHRNKLRWLTDASATYESFGTKIATNLGLPGGRLSVGFGKVIVVEGAGDAETGLAPPNLMEISSNGQYGPLGELGSSYAEEIQIAAGVPEADVIRQAGAPPSGISRYIARMGLVERRKNDMLQLIPFEQDLSDITCLVWNEDVVPKIGGAPLPKPATQDARGEAELEVIYADEQILLEPDKAFELATLKFTAGVMTAVEYVRAVDGRSFATDAEAIAYIAENKKLYMAIVGAPPPTDPAAGVATKSAGPAPETESDPNIETDTTTTTITQ